MKDSDRVVSFSVRPEDTKNREELQKLKQHCRDNNKTFSLEVLQAIKLYNEKLQSDATTRK